MQIEVHLVADQPHVFLRNAGDGIVSKPRRSLTVLHLEPAARNSRHLANRVSCRRQHRLALVNARGTQWRSPSAFVPNDTALTSG
jgi:hypothetical protein